MRRKAAMVIIGLALCLYPAAAVEAQTKVLTYGAVGWEVKDLQTYLKKAHFYNGKISGNFDKATLEAVKKFQKTKNMKVDGKAGPELIRAIKTSKPTKFDANTHIIASYGMRGQSVREIQEHLIKAGYLQGAADGVYGQKTYTAVRAFQEQTKLKADGIVGTLTMDVLKKYKPSKKLPPKSLPKITSKAPVNNNKPKTGAEESWKPINLEATAYTRHDEGCTDYTYRGTYLRRGLVAVDPDVIPLGTRLYIPDYGYAVADDIGGAIQGYKIDLAMDTLSEAFAYGRRHITAYIIN